VSTHPCQWKQSVASFLQWADCDYDPKAAFQTWFTGDFLHGGNIRIYGLQGFLFSGGNVVNSALIDLDANTADSDKMRIGDVEVSCPPGELPY